MSSKRESAKALDVLIVDASTALMNMDVTENDYEETLARLERLHAIRAAMRGQGVSPDALMTVFGNLAGIAIIVGHERTHIITSKALAFILKLR